MGLSANGASLWAALSICGSFVSVLGWVTEMATGGMVALSISAVFEVAELG